MKVALFSSKAYDQKFFLAANDVHGHSLSFFQPHLSLETVPLARDFPCVCAFVNDRLDEPVLRALAGQGVRHVALRCSGFNHVDLKAARELGIAVTRVPAYSPHAVAEHAVTLLLALNRKIYRSYARVRDGNFALDGLLGFDLNGRTVGVIGTGQIGAIFARIMAAFGCRVLAYDVARNAECEEAGVRYVPLLELYRDSDIVSLHCPLLPETHHIINAKSLEAMRAGVMLINTGRGALIDTRAAIAALKSGKIGHLGLDVYEEESDLFFEDLSGRVIQDDVFTRLLTFPNVIITAHQAFFTENALRAIAETALGNVSQLEKGEACPNRIEPSLARP